MVNGKKPNIRLINSAFVIEKTDFQDPSDFHLDRPIATCQSLCTAQPFSRQGCLKAHSDECLRPGLQPADLFWVFRQVANSIDGFKDRHLKMQGRASDLLDTFQAPVKAQQSMVPEASLRPLTAKPSGATGKV